MDTVIVWVAQGLLWVMGAAWIVGWILVSRRDGFRSAAIQVVVTAIAGLALMLIAQALHHDPRPFVENPTVHPLFPHAADDGFPSDHAVAAGAMTGLIATRFRLLWIPFAVAAVAIAWARVAAHVHHGQDVIAGLAIGVVAALLGWLVARMVVNYLRRRSPAPADAHAVR